MTLSVSSNFQHKLPTGRPSKFTSSNNSELHRFTSNLYGGPSTFRRTRNDEEEDVYGSFRRYRSSSSNAPNKHVSMERTPSKPRYAQDTLNSIRRSKERSLVRNSLRRSSGPPKSSKSSSNLEELKKEQETYKSKKSNSRSQYLNRVSNLESKYISSIHSSCSSSSSTSSSSNSSFSSSLLNKYPHFYNLSSQHKQKSLPSSELSQFTRAYSFRDSTKKLFGNEYDDEYDRHHIHHKVPGLQSKSKSNLTPNSSSLVLNSLAYQLLPSKLKSTSLAHESLRRKTYFDDLDGHLSYMTGDVIGNRYEIQGTLGEGTFGKVAKIRDLRTNQIQALKIIKNNQKYREAANLEIFVLKTIQEKDPGGKNRCVRLFDSFDFHGHVCLCFEVLGDSVFDVLKSNHYTPFPLHQVKHISWQLCKAVSFLHASRLSHTDLKPENILFTSSSSEDSVKGLRFLKNTNIKLIDFGSATFEWEYHSTIVSTRHYRAPEVILEIGWSYPCDVWSIGCIIFELFEGNTLFQTHNNREHLAMMEKTLDTPMPLHLVRKSKTKYFDSKSGVLLWNSNSPDAQYTNKHCKTLKQRANGFCHKGNYQEILLLFQLLSQLLNYDPETRISLQESLSHSFFDRVASGPLTQNLKRLQM